MSSDSEVLEQKLNESTINEATAESSHTVISDVIEFFNRRMYSSKEDIVDAVIEYHSRLLRPFKSIVSNKRQYKAVCVVPECPFIVRFAFTSSFGGPTLFVPHSFPMDPTSKGANKKWTAKSLSKNEEVRKLFVQCGRLMTPINIQRRVSRMGHSVSYMNCVNAFALLNAEFYGDELQQYSRLPSYVSLLNSIKHEACCEVRNEIFHRLAILYREGLHAFRQYTARGICVDGTFLRTFVGGTLLICCFRNGNNEIQIIGVAVVSIENEDNWTFFLKFLLKHIAHPSAFIISERDKGLTPAVKSVLPDVQPFSCFRHLMENFNRKFKSKGLKDTAWALARACTSSGFEYQEKKLRQMNNKAADYFMDIEREKWSLCFSSCPRYGMSTSIGVELINSALRGIRKLPIIDCLLAIERYVGTKWSANALKAN